MTFLNPLFLWFLPLVSIPVIIHLLAKRKSKRIEFPSLIFLKHLEQDALKRFNLKQLILLIIRTLLILLIIISFARPTLNSEYGFGIRTQKTDLIVIVLDNTASFHRSFDQVVGPWLGELEEMLEERGTRVMYCSSSEFELSDTYRDIRPVFEAVFPGNINERIESQQDIDNYKHKSLIWIGDGQDVSEKLAPLQGWNLYVLKIDVLDDRGILALVIPKRTLVEDDTYQIETQLGFGSNASEMALELSVNDKRINQALIKSSTSQVDIGGRILEPGYQEGVLEIEHDEEIFNDLRYFVLEAAGDILVQIIRSTAQPDFWNSINLALGSVDANLRVDILGYEQIDELNTASGGSIIIDDASIVPEYVWNQLEIFTTNGGQVILFGNGGDKMADLLGFRTSLVEEESRLSFGLMATEQVKNDLQHIPITNTISEKRLKIYKRFHVASAELDQTWIRFLDDQPFLGTKYNNSGRFIWFNTEFALEASNLALLGVFPSMILELSQFSADDGPKNRYNVEIGDTISFVPSPEKGSEALFSVQRPDGTVDFQQPDSNFVIYYSQTNIPGIYRFLHGREVLFPVAVNVSSREAGAHQKKNDLSDEIHVHNNVGELSSAVMNRSTGFALWPVLLLLVLGLWLSEIFLSRIQSNWRSNERDR